MATSVVGFVALTLVLPLLHSEVVTDMVSCKYERNCFPGNYFGDTDCMSYANISRCSAWTITSFEKAIEKVESVTICDKATEDEFRFSVNSTMALLLPLSFFPSQGISLRFISQENSLSEHKIYLSDSLSLQYSGMYEMSIDFNTFLVRINRYPVLGRLYLIIYPAHPFSASVRLYSSVSPLVVPATEYHIQDFIRKYLLPTSIFSFQLVFLIAMVIVLLMCCVDVTRSSDSMLWLSRESRNLIRKLKTPQRTYRFEPPA